MKVKQVILRSTTSELTTWLESRPDIKVGNTVELKETGKRLWKVVRVFEDIEVDSSDLEFHRKWDNNNYDHHKGLGL